MFSIRFPQIFGPRKPRRVRLQSQSSPRSGEVLETRQLLSAVSPGVLAGNSRVAAVSNSQPVAVPSGQGNSRVAVVGSGSQTAAGGALSNVALNPSGSTFFANRPALVSRPSITITALTQDSEPNNSPGQAGDLGRFGPGRYSKTIYGHIGLSGDSQDWYKLKVTGQTTASFSLGSMTRDLDLELYDASRTRIAFSNRGSTANDVISRTLEAGTYYVRVVQYQRNVSGYTLRVNLNVGPTSGRLPDSQLPTNGSGIASGRIESRQEQWFRFTITTRRSVTFGLSGLSSDLDLEVYRGSTTSSQRLGFSTKGGTANESVQLNSLAAGTYWVRVFPFTTTGSAYRLTFNLTGRV
ncbi:MAG TPA: PPC domain-containing protein [Planctomycetaceae bacterium]|nr:PPC domain-containing protein [Planctomycetaceae bacterium]HQZ66048.1 PPC domain-containing protein [Planctomycetaceae bacterium]